MGLWTVSFEQRTAMSEEIEPTPLSYALFAIVVFFCCCRVKCNKFCIPQCIELRSCWKWCLGCCGCDIGKSSCYRDDKTYQLGDAHFDTDPSTGPGKGPSNGPRTAKLNASEA